MTKTKQILLAIGLAITAVGVTIAVLKQPLITRKGSGDDNEE